MNVRRFAISFTKNTLAVCGVVAGFSFFSLAYANTYSFITPPGANVDDGPVSASATFITGTNSIQVTLTNLLSNPTSAGQLLSDIFFVAGGLISGTGAKSPSSATYVTVADDGTTSAGAGPAVWELTNSGGTYHLNGLFGKGAGGTGPHDLIIGPPGAGGIYSNANGSIAGNTPHNPFINQTATFTLALAGATSSTVISDVVFSFGTQEGSNVAGVPVPIPAAVWLFASGLIALVGIARRNRGNGAQPSPIGAAEAQRCANVC